MPKLNSKTYLRRIRNMDPVDRFLHWFRERHMVHLKRMDGEEAPWTDDPILQRNFFTNPYRENDKVTQWLKKCVREPLRNNDSVLFATVAFRWFNKPDPTGIALTYDRRRRDSKNPKTVDPIFGSLLYRWNEETAVSVIEGLAEDGPVFTGAYMIKAGNGEPGCKVKNVCSAITKVWEQRQELVDLCYESNSMEAVCKRLQKFMFLGPFMSYEVVCDLRYTHLLQDADDVSTWTNMGPGAIRGLHRMQGGTIEERKSIKLPKDWLEQVRQLLIKTRLAFAKDRRFPTIEMREIEHSLCEWDKYERVLQGDGMKVKRVYDATGGY